MHNRVWLGIIFLLFGLGFLLHQMGVWDFPHVLGTWWPLILIIVGIIQLSNRNDSSWVSALLFMLVGGLFMINQLMDIHLTAYIWPLIIIFIGLVIIFSKINREKPIHSEHTIETFVLFSGTDVRSQSKNFEGGSITAIFGGSEINLRDTIIPEEGATFDLTAIFGGITITAPENASVEFTGTPIFGGWEDKTRKRVNEDELPVLKLNCITICGGVEVKD